METLASDTVAPANAENTAPVDAAEPDGEAPKTEGDGSAPSGTEAASPEKPTRDKVQERIDTLTREKYDALRERDLSGYELQRLNARIAELEKAKPPEVAPQESFPTLEQFGYDEAKFNAAVAEHYSKLATKQAREAAKAALETAREAEREERAMKAWSSKEAEFIKSKPDYVEKVQNARTLPISTEVQEALRESEFGPQVAYHLVENPEVARAILQLSPSAQLREIGRIEARLEAAKAKPAPAVSQAPPPPSKVDAAEAPEHIRLDGPDSDKLSDAEWTRRRNAQERARLRKQRGA